LCSAHSTGQRPAHRCQELWSSEISPRAEADDEDSGKDANYELRELIDDSIELNHWIASERTGMKIDIDQLNESSSEI